MAILKVARLGHPVLRLEAEALSQDTIKTPAFQRFCDDLLETMLEYDGTGLAAPQVHTSIRVVVLALDDDRDPEFLVNPIITVLGDTTDTMMEGCLSIPDMRGRVERPDHIRVQAWDRFGTLKAYELEGFPAVVTQHECDHLDGILYIDRCDLTTLAFKPEYDRFGPIDEWLNEDEEATQTDLNEIDLEQALLEEEGA